MRVRCKDEEVERTMAFHHISVSVPRTFGDYCSYFHDIFLFWHQVALFKAMNPL